MNPEGLVIVIGASPITPKIKGIENATQILEAYNKLHELDGRIVVFGGGAIGTEAALELAEEGKDGEIRQIQEILYLQHPFCANKIFILLHSRSRFYQNRFLSASLFLLSF